jgi:predicted  nucleic acid-binding Zn-ribbon protein
MQVLEQELLRLAPTIADVFQRISQSTSQVPVSQEDIKKVKEDNERLRKTNRTLIEKLNTFQQRIIRLQLENKNLREAGEGAKNTIIIEIMQFFYFISLFSHINFDFFNF